MKMELFKEYIKEREGCETLIVDNGFLTAKVEVDGNDNKFLFINDFFVSKKDRVKARKTATKLLALAKETAMRYNCLKICGIVWTNADNATESLKANLYYGYRIAGTGKDCIYVETDLSEVKHPMTKKN